MNFRVEAFDSVLAAFGSLDPVTEREGTPPSQASPHTTSLPSGAMDVAPAFACGCLNIKIYPKAPGDNVDSQRRREPQATSECLDVYVGESGIIVVRKLG